MADLSLAGNTILVTGACRGIGWVIADTLYRDGANAVIHYGSNPAPADALSGEFGDRGLAVKADLNKPDE